MLAQVISSTRPTAACNSNSVDASFERKAASNGCTRMGSSWPVQAGSGVRPPTMPPTSASACDRVTPGLSRATNRPSVIRYGINRCASRNQSVKSAGNIPITVYFSSPMVSARPMMFGSPETCLQYS